MPESTKFTFVLDTEQTMANLDQLKLVDYSKFKRINHLGTLLQSYAKDDDWVSITLARSPSKKQQKKTPPPSPSSSWKLKMLSSQPSTCATMKLSSTSSKTDSKLKKSQKTRPLPSATPWSTLKEKKFPWTSSKWCKR